MLNMKDSSRVKNDHHLVLPILLREVHATPTSSPHLRAWSRTCEDLFTCVVIAVSLCMSPSRSGCLAMMPYILSTRCPAHPLAFQRILSAGSSTTCTLLVLGKSQLRLHVGKHLLCCKNTHLGRTQLRLQTNHKEKRVNQNQNQNQNLGWLDHASTIGAWYRRLCLS